MCRRALCLQTTNVYFYLLFGVFLGCENGMEAVYLVWPILKACITEDKSYFRNSTVNSFIERLVVSPTVIFLPSDHEEFTPFKIVYPTPQNVFTTVYVLLTCYSTKLIQDRLA